MRGPQPARDWSTLRSGPNNQDRAGSGNVSGAGTNSSGSGSAPSYGRGRGTTVSGGRASGGIGGSGTDGASSWRTDEEISAQGQQRSEPRQLQRWEPAECNTVAEGSALQGTLEELSSNGGGGGGWNQFRVNYEMFGVQSTFKEDLSQYTTPLDTSRVPLELKRRANQIAQEIDSRGTKQDDGAEEDGEEELFASVPRAEEAGRLGGAGHVTEASCSGARSSGSTRSESKGTAVADETDAGGALLATLRAAPGATRGTADHRALVAPKVQSWWRARSVEGESVPAGAEDALICPFSRRVFGDVSQLITHWAAALPRDGASESATPESVVTEQFRRAGHILRWSQMVADTSLGTTLPINTPRQGSVWAQVLARLARGRPEHEPVEESLVADFVSEAVQMKCWRREQKVEHREVLEGIATGLALHILDDSYNGTWSTPPEAT